MIGRPRVFLPFGPRMLRRGWRNAYLRPWFAYWYQQRLPGWISDEEAYARADRDLAGRPWTWRGPTP